MNQDFFTAKIVSDALQDLAKRIAEGALLVEKFDVASDGVLKIEIACIEGEQPEVNSHVQIGAAQCPKCKGTAIVDSGDGMHLCMPCNDEF